MSGAPKMLLWWRVLPLASCCHKYGDSDFASQNDGGKTGVTYCTTMMGACQKVPLPPVGSSTVTWQSYLPGSSGPRSMEKLSGATCRRVLGSGETSCGCVSYTF